MLAESQAEQLDEIGFHERGRSLDLFRDRLVDR